MAAVALPAVAAPDDLQAQLEQARARLDALDVAASTAVEDVDEAAVALAATGSELAELQARLDHLDTQAGGRQRAANRYAARRRAEAEATRTTPEASPAPPRAPPAAGSPAPTWDPASP